MSRPIHRSAVILSSLLFFSACEKKTESSSTTTNPEESSPGKPTKSTRNERHGGGTRAERETAAKEDIRKALDAAESEADPVARQKALAQVAWDAIDIDPAIAKRAFEGITPGSEDARKLVAHFAMRMADADPDAALEWARGLEQAEERDDALGRIAGVIAENDPYRGATLATEEVPEGPLRNKAVVEVVQRWAQKNPTEASTWITSLPEGPARRGAVIHLARNWSSADANGFANWASRQQSGLPEITTTVASMLRSVPDEKERKKRLAAFTDPVFRQRIEEEYKRTTFQPQLGNPKTQPPSK